MQIEPPADASRAHPSSTVCDQCHHYHRHRPMCDWLSDGRTGSGSARGGRLDVNQFFFPPLLSSPSDQSAQVSSFFAHPAGERNFLPRPPCWPTKLHVVSALRDSDKMASCRRVGDRTMIECSAANLYLAGSSPVGAEREAEAEADGESERFASP